MTSPPRRPLVSDAVYEFHNPNPGRRIEVEIVFIHGLQLRCGGFRNAYYGTWRTRDRREVWPETWHKRRYSQNARILSLAYDSSALTTSEQGNMGPFVLSESLLECMISTENTNIGQTGCPVIFVCHSLGGLISKEIVLRCQSRVPSEKYLNLLLNIRAFFFYATPHQGSNLTNWFKFFPLVKSSSLVTYLETDGRDRGHTHAAFLHILGGHNGDCKFYVVAEGRKSKIPCRGLICVPCLPASETWLQNKCADWVVDENSARFPGRSEFVTLNDADHMTVCKPQDETDAGYQMLIECIDSVIRTYTTVDTVPFPVRLFGIGDKIAEVARELVEVSVVGLFGTAGVGKSTLSKHFYNLNAVHYAKSCYLQNVKSREIQDVQKELLRGLYGVKLDQNEGVKEYHLDMIKKCFLTQNVLVVIDDVTSIECLEDLLVELRRLTLSYFAGRLPKSIKLLPQLQRLEFRYCNFDSLSESLAGLRPGLSILEVPEGRSVS